MSSFIKTGLSVLLILSVCFLWSATQYGYRDWEEYIDFSVGGAEAGVSDVEFDAFLDRVKISGSIKKLKAITKGTEFRIEEDSDLLTFLMDLYSVELAGGEFSIVGNDPTEFMDFKIDNLSVEFSDMDMVTSMRDDIPNINFITGELSLRGMELNISPRLSYEFYDVTRELWGTPGVLAIDRFNAEVSYNRRGLITLDGSLSTPYGKASVEGKVLFDDRYPERSPIRKFELTVQNLSEELQEALEEWERESGSSLPRKGRNIEIIITGTLGEPLMDGKPLIERSYDEWDYGEDAEEAWDYNDKSAEIILVAYDWVYPDMDNPMGAWKFSSDGTFNHSTTTFGGMTRTGTWKDLGNDSKVKLDYDDGGTGELEITSSTTFKVGSTTYNRY